MNSCNTAQGRASTAPHTVLGKASFAGPIGANQAGFPWPGISKLSHDEVLPWTLFPLAASFDVTP